MRPGSLVQTLKDFSELAAEWGFDYPKLGELLVVKTIEPHHVFELRKLGINLLTFEEYPYLIPVCDKTSNKIWNFIEIQPPIKITIGEEISIKEL